MPETYPSVDVAICAVPTAPHLGVIFQAVCDSLKKRHVSHRLFPNAAELISDVSTLSQVKIILGMGGMPIRASVMDLAPHLHALVSVVSGTDGFDIPAATERGIIIGHAPTHENVRGMAEAAVMLMLNLIHRYEDSRLAMSAGLYDPTQLKAQSLLGKTIGIIGTGRIAICTMDLLRSWGTRVLVHSRRGAAAQIPDHALAITLPELLQQSDVVCMLAGAVAGEPPLIGQAQLNLMKPSAYLINLSRGSTVDELAVSQALHENKIAGAALDVFRIEPLPKESPLWQTPRLVLTPHRVGHTIEAFESLVHAAVANIEALLNHKPPVFVCNPNAQSQWLERWTS